MKIYWALIFLSISCPTLLSIFLLIRYPINYFKNIFTQIHIFDVFYLLNFLIKIILHFWLNFYILFCKVGRNRLLDLRLFTDWFNTQFQHLSRDLFYSLAWSLVLSLIKIFILRIKMRVFVLNLFQHFKLFLLKVLLSIFIEYFGSDKLGIFWHLFDNNILSLKESKIFIVLNKSKNTIHDLFVVMHGGVSVDLENLVIKVNLNVLLFKFFF